MQMDQRTRKLMTMNKELHPRDDVDRLYVLLWNFSDWFTVSKGDKLLVSILLPTPIARATSSVLLVLSGTIFYFGVSFNHKQTGKNMTQGFSNKPKMKTTRNAQFRIQIISIINPKRKGMYAK